MNTLDFAQAALTVYIVALVIAESYIMKPIRVFFRTAVAEFVPWWIAEHFVRYGLAKGDELDSQEELRNRVITSDEKETQWEEERDYAGYDFIGCRLCVGAWVTNSLAVWWIPLEWLLPVWGAAWFLTKQER